MREYETIVILKTDMSEEASERIFGRVETAMTELNGVMLARDNWGKKKLAYDIAKHSKGAYILLHFLGEGPLIREIERIFKIEDGVLRYMTVKLDDDVDPEARVKALNKDATTVEGEADDAVVTDATADGAQSDKTATDGAKDDKDKKDEKDEKAVVKNDE